MTKEYLLKQIERLEIIIKEGTKYRFTERLSKVRYELFKHSMTLSRFKKEILLKYLEELVDEGFRLGLLDNTFTYWYYKDY